MDEDIKGLKTSEWSLGLTTCSLPMIILFLVRQALVSVRILRMLSNCLKLTLASWLILANQLSWLAPKFVQIRNTSCKTALRFIPPLFLKSI